MHLNTNANRVMESGNHFKNGASPKSQMSRRNILMAIMLMCFCAFTFNACYEDETPKTIAVTSIDLNKTSLALTVGSSENLVLTVLPHNATDKTVRWSSNDRSVAHVDNNGQVTAVGVGTTYIIAEVRNAGALLCEVTVSDKVVSVTSINLNKTSLALTVGDSEGLVATILPHDATINTVTWRSDNSNIATVSNTGLVTAVRAGTVTIGAMADGKLATCFVTVNPQQTLTITSPSYGTTYSCGDWIDIFVSGYTGADWQTYLELEYSCLVGEPQHTLDYEPSLSFKLHDGRTVNKATAYPRKEAYSFTFSPETPSVWDNRWIKLVVVNKKNNTRSAPQYVRIVPSDDGLTEDIRNILPDDILEKVKELGIEINGGNNPPNIEGTYFLSPLILVRSNFADGHSPGHKYDDMEITLSKQDNAKQTIVMDYKQSVQIGSGLGSFITGNGNKFTVYTPISGTFHGRPFKSVDIYSGEITSTGIKNLNHVLIMTQAASYSLLGPNTIRNGQGRLFYDSDGFSERITQSNVPTLRSKSSSGVPITIISSAQE